MRLYEYEAKERLCAYGIEIPTGFLWPGPGAVRYPVVAKAQILEGGRGKRGGVVTAADDREVRIAAESLLRGSHSLAAAAAVLVEEKLEVEREMYVGLLLDRDARSPTLLVCPEGGQEVEAIERRRFWRLDVDPVGGLSGRVVRKVVAALQLDVYQTEALGDLLSSLWRFFRADDCLLVEVNPLVLTISGKLLAADAHVILDDSARWRHSGWPAPREGSDFERRCAELGAAATELDGDIAIITSGAGLGMATVDLVTALGGRARCFVDLGGAVFRESGAIAEIVSLTCSLRPRVLLVNCFLQLARCDVVAAGIAEGVQSWENEPYNVVRMRGRHFDEARSILASSNCLLTQDLHLAVTKSIAAAHSDQWRFPGINQCLF
jgi:succinyl-CoA synthetase beta subunit